MQDRIPTPGQEGRVLITPENGGTAYYATIQMADNPTQAGTPWNKASVLQDTTAALYGLDANAVPNDVLEAIKPLISTAQNTADTKAKIASGTYVGNGSTSLTINVGFKPKLFVIYPVNGSLMTSDTSTNTAFRRIYFFFEFSTSFNPLNNNSTVYAAYHNMTSTGISLTSSANSPINMNNQNIAWFALG